MDKIVNDANSQISHLQNKLSGEIAFGSSTVCSDLRQGMQVDQDNLRRKSEELAQTLREKSRKLLQTQELYDKLKRRAMLGQVQDAALGVVDDTIQASSNANRFVDRVRPEDQRRASHSILQDGQNGRMQSPGLGQNIEMNMGPPQVNRSRNVDGTWSGFGSPGRQENVPRKYKDWLPPLYTIADIVCRKYANSDSFHAPTAPRLW